MNLVIVESPAKAKTINKYLGDDFKVLASFGHIRDLPSKDGSVDTDNNFAMIWETDGRSEKQIREIAAAARDADTIYLATDPDREGEAISWHILEVLEQKKLLRGREVHRVVFHEITKKAVTDAIANPRALNQELVDAYLARRALDYLVGFNLSPVLWRKLPGSRSAGRVQSVALRLICEREIDIEAFRPDEYWSLEANFGIPEGKFSARLTHLDGKKLDKLAIGNEGDAKIAKEKVEARSYTVSKVERKDVKRRPQPPFTTSTLQQEASRKLGFGTKRTMQLAQRLYEGVDIGGETVGLITYMRTDAVILSSEALAGARRLIDKDYGKDYLPAAPRSFANKAKNAQEAHEAIRPTDVFRRPDQVSRHLDKDQLALYTLIWKRTVACQMEDARFDQVAVDLASNDNHVVLRANGSVVKFDGFLRLYQEGKDDSDDDDNDRRLPPLKEGQKPDLEKVSIDQHFTQPPPRYTEASLVKRMEELGIGRPSTYASIISVLQDRNYVTLEKRRFIAQDRGRLVTAFLSKFFERYVQYNFTADLENQLDDVSNGDRAWRDVLTEFWTSFKGNVDEAKELKITDVLDALQVMLENYLFAEREDGSDPHKCPKCEEGTLSLKLGKFGAFLGCSNYPDCNYTRPLVANDNPGNAELDSGPKILGVDSTTGKEITLRKGPYGVYVQLGEEETVDGKNGKPKKVKPKRTSLPKGLEPTVVDLTKAEELLTLPRDVGVYPETGEEIKANIGRFGPYVQAGSTFASLKADDDVLTIGENRAITLIADKREKAGKEIGKHPDDNEPILLADGRWGPFVKHKKTNANLPRDTVKEDVTLEMAIAALKEKEAKSGKTTSAGAKKTAAKKEPAKKAAPKKTAAKKPAAKKTTAKKTPAKKAAAK
ncbi:type I DNA topoisomerase [uncultured Thalassospira sp.]|jgi:DNA topoisomerase-1|uniref:type I DNA topoisomerase n=1 Tax=uncultured Thalassospira sp. TaxID=404382 RepID=UPI0030DD2828|tara:strand:- start:2384 stop:5044 length:2661 start_codon:yes stop_codon:yes gene_type:complete